MWVDQKEVGVTFLVCCTIVKILMLYFLFTLGIVLPVKKFRKVESLEVGAIKILCCHASKYIIPSLPRRVHLVSMEWVVNLNSFGLYPLTT